MLELSKATRNGDEVHVSDVLQLAADRTAPWSVQDASLQQHTNCLPHRTGDAESI